MKNTNVRKKQISPLIIMPSLDEILSGVSVVVTATRAYRSKKKIAAPIERV